MVYGINDGTTTGCGRLKTKEVAGRFRCKQRFTALGVDFKKLLSPNLILVFNSYLKNRILSVLRGKCISKNDMLYARMKT